MSRIRGKNTKPEVKLRSLLHNAGFRFRVHDKKLPGNPDIVLPKYKSVVFVNGCFWHQHGGCKYCYMPKTRREFWEKKLSDTVKRDQANYMHLQEMGWHVFVIWECELKRDSQSILERLIKQLKEKI